MERVHCSSLQECLISGRRIITDQMLRCMKHATQSHVITGRIVVRRDLGQSGPGKLATVRLYSSTQIDPETGRGKLSEKARMKDGKNTKENGIRIITYTIKFLVEPSFGIPGALLVKNQHKHEFFLKFATLDTPHNRVVHFECNSWVYPYSKTKTDRLFFSNTSYLPSQTPKALMELRNEELISLRGDGSGERKEWDRIYDYDHYNDLGNPDEGPEYARPVLGGSDTYPYPRRGRTGRRPCESDPSSESRPGFMNLDIYVPPDERFSPKKMAELISNSMESIVHFLIPEAKSLFEPDTANFETLEEIFDMYSSNRNQALEGWITEKLKHLVPEELLKGIHKASKEKPINFPLPQIIAGDEKAWLDDEEFGRQMLAGINPNLIKHVEKFPFEGKNGKKSAITASHIEHNLDGFSIESVMAQWRLFILDHHEYLMPFLNRINVEGVCAYASRTVLFLRQDASLKPVAIELSLPGSEDGEEINRVFVPATQGTEAALWKLAKTHVATNDSGYHQLITHWLKTHAVVEPFVISTRRNLSAMHPIHRLLDPHFKDTMHINALARSIILNSGGVLEKTMYTGKISMELSSMLYKDWRFNEQGFPADLIKRNMAFEDSQDPSGVLLLFLDYPYGADGQEVWAAINTWVKDFCSIFYTSDDAICSDVEIQTWWSEIRNVGHGDKRHESWGYELNTLSNLIEALTTLIWIASALHASANFGQYAYGGFPPNRPSLCRKFIPEEGTLEFAEFLKDPDKYFLKMLPERFEMTLGVVLVQVLSKHTSDEVYLGQRGSSDWTDNEDVCKSFEKFAENLREVEKKIFTRNRDRHLRNRWGPARIPYTLLDPQTSNVSNIGGITGKGIPNSVSI